jgi:putative colanic acid biosynthesis UDP-glucose lipid carrier transferase
MKAEHCPADTRDLPCDGERNADDQNKQMLDPSLRALDLCLILLLAPLLCALILTIFLLRLAVDGRPLLFAQERLGKAGRPFRMYKLATVPRWYVYLPDHWPTATFPPRTRLGRLLRSIDLDELPQFLNVLKGDMSLVGPRPETKYHTERILSQLPTFCERLAVRPGLTGLAQVSGWRGDTSLACRLRCDLAYVRERSFALYLSILCRTVLMELRHFYGH